MFDTQLSGVTETTWTLMKYTNLNGRRQEILPSLGNLYVTVNISRRYISVVNGVTVLEELALIGNPPPVFKIRDRDVFVRTVSKAGIVTSKFRIKFILASDHGAFVNVISQYITITRCENESTALPASQDVFYLSHSQGFEHYGTSNSPQKRTFSELSNSIPNKKIRKDFSSRTTVDETTLISTQTSSKFSQPFQECSSSVSDVGVQTEPLLSLNDISNNETLLKSLVASRLRDPAFRILLIKTRNFVEDLAMELGGSITEWSKYDTCGEKDQKIGVNVQESQNTSFEEDLFISSIETDKNDFLKIIEKQKVEK
ncbi:unnamed protein product [Enterobius vermicularis]|uniref:Movement protein n=1 Tax=Enterobius vermicularis TaxID=51028 RepID=A0A0N4VBU5_ENTVE|nr:unnamed protein product [Enterobius vermicularis]